VSITLHPKDFQRLDERFCRLACRGGNIFVAKLASIALALLSFMMLPTAMSAQLIPHGNVYVGASYSDSDIVTANRMGLKGWNASGEAIVLPHVGVVADVSGYYAPGIKQYNFLFGPRLAVSWGRWRPFAQALFGIQRITLNGNSYRPFAVDFGGGVDYRLIKAFSWRVQGDYVHTNYLSAQQNDVRGSTGVVFRF
jgi:hypothetical protein